MADVPREHRVPGGVAPRCTLSVTDGPWLGRRFEVESALEIGRASTDCTLDDSQVSRRHAIVRIDGNDVVIEDLGSSNGTWVNELRIEGPVVLRDGDLLRVGTTRLAVGLTAAPAPVNPGRAVVAAPLEPQGLPPRARRSIITVAVIAAVIVVAIVVVLLVLGGR